MVKRVSGYVEDAQSREKLFGATILITGTTTGTTTNFYGYFSLQLPDNQQDITVSFVGYQAFDYHFNLKNDTTLTIQLEPTVELQEVVIEGRKEEAIQLSPQVSSIDIPTKQLLRMPAIGGEIDVLKAIQLLPGVQSGKEGTTGIYVRGGGPDQNLILLDGVPLYSVSHLGGLFSVFNPDVISDVNLIKGGFPARYGGRLSSVINIKMKDGNRNENDTNGAIGLISSRVTTEGPFANGKGSYLFGFRRTYIDLFTRPISRAASGGDYGFGYYFYDLNGKLTYDFGPKDKLSVSQYSGDDKAVVNFDISDGDQGKFYTKWGNFLSTAKWSHLYSDRLFSNLTLNYTRYHFIVNAEIENKKENTAAQYQYKSGIQDVGMRYEFEYFLTNQHNILSGVQVTQHFFTPGLSAFKTKEPGEKVDTTFGSFNIRAQEFNYYIEDQWEATSKLKFNFGVHFNLYSAGKSFYFSPQPRISGRYLVDRYSSIKASYATMQQNVHLLSNSGSGLPTDLWVPATGKTPPQKSSQITVGYSRSIGRGFEASIEGYYKEMKNQIVYSDGTNWLDGNGDWQTKIEKNGLGVSKGLEFFLQKKEGKFTGWVGYTLSKTDQKFANVNNGEFFPYRYDRRHDVGIVASYRLTKRIDLSATWVYGTGNAITLGTARYLAYDPNWFPDLQDPENGNDTFDFGSIEYYSGRNQFRMKSYHRSDLGIRFTKEKKWGERTWNWGFYNVYNRANPYYYYWSYDYRNDRRILKQTALFPLIPSFSYEFRFK